MITPDDEVVVEVMRKNRSRSMSNGGASMRAWEDQSVEVLRMELLRRGISCKELVYQGVMHDKEKLLQLLKTNETK